MAPSLVHHSDPSLKIEDTSREYYAKKMLDLVKHRRSTLPRSYSSDVSSSSEDESSPNLSRRRREVSNRAFERSLSCALDSFRHCRKLKCLLVL